MRLCAYIVQGETLTIIAVLRVVVFRNREDTRDDLRRARGDSADRSDSINLSVSRANRMTCRFFG